MEIHEPLIITSRLMPGVRVGGASISIEARRRGPDGRTRYLAFIDFPDGSVHVIDDLRSGCQGGDIYEGMSSLLAFLGAAAESYQYRQRTGLQGENEDLFPPSVVAWAAENADDIMNLELWLDEREVSDECAGH